MFPGLREDKTLPVFQSFNSGGSRSLLTMFRIAQRICGTVFNKVNPWIRAGRGCQLVQGSCSLQCVVTTIGFYLCEGQLQSILQVIGKSVPQTPVDFDRARPFVAGL